MVDVCAYCALIVRRIYKIYGADPWMVGGWFIGVLLAGTRNREFSDTIGML